jgi:hypothetical protein
MKPFSLIENIIQETSSIIVKMEAIITITWNLTRAPLDPVITLTSWNHASFTRN